MTDSREPDPADPTLSADRAAAQRIAQRYPGARGRASLGPRHRRADALLLLELLAHLCVPYALVYLGWPTWLKVALLVPWSLYSALAVDNILHYQNHWPLFRGEGANRLARLLYVPLFLSPLEVRYTHWEHHKYNDIEIDQETWLRAMLGRGGRLAVLRYIAGEALASLRGASPLAPLPPHMERLRQARPAHHREIRLMRWANLAWLAALVLLDPVRTLCLFVPAVILVPSLTSVLMNITDHLPGELLHPFRQATYLEPASPRERLLCALNRQSGATHLTHHLFPQVHWTELRALQRELLPIYQRHGAPRSMLHSTALLGDWLAALRLVARIGDEARRMLDEIEARKAE